MVKSIKILTVASALIAQPAIAQTQRTQGGFNVPHDVPLYTEEFGGYEAGTTLNTLGDGSNAWGGVMPVIATQPADIPSTATGWKGTGPSHATGPEVKFRTLSNGSHISPNDPIRNFGAPGTSHLHQFFGATTANAYSTYTTLRNQANALSTSTRKRAASTIAGGPYNGTAYWVPCLIKTNPFADGKNYCVKINSVTVYYQSTTAAGALQNRLPRGLRYVFGKNMDDPNDTIVNAEIAAANAQPGTAGRYASTQTNAFVGWSCRSSADVLVLTSGGQTYSPHLKSTGGVDPWAGACLSGYKVSASLSTPECYDGTNLWSPGGQIHFRYVLTDTQNSLGACPKGWYRVPTVQMTLSFYHKGFADFGTWRLASDDQFEAKLTELGTPRTIANGESMHGDWLGAWDDEVFYGNAAGTVKGWQKFCSGVEGNTGTQCDSSTFNATNHLIGGYNGENAPDNTRTPQVNQTANQFDTSVATGMYEIPAAWKGPITLRGSGVTP